MRAAPFDETRSAMLGEQLLQLGRYQDAAELASDMLAHRESATALVLLSMALQRLGRHDEALTAAQRATAIQPDHLGAWAAVALAQSALGAGATAVAAAAERVRLAPHDWYGYVLKSELIDKWFVSPEGLSAAEEAVRLAPNNPLAHRALGNAQLHRRSRSKARSSFREALRLDPQDAAPRLGIAALDLATAPGTAAADLIDVTRAHPQEALVTYNLRIALARVLAGTWFLVFGGALLSFVLAVVRTTNALSAIAAVVIQLTLAVVVIAAVLVLWGRVLRLDRARRALRFALAADRSLVVLATALLIGLVGLFGLAFIPPPGQGLILIALYVPWWVVSSVAILAWRAKIDTDERRL